MRNSLTTVVVVLLLLGAQAAQAETWSMQCPPGWSDQRPAAGNDLVKQCISPGQDAFVELYASKGELLPLDNLLQQWESAMLAKGMPFQTRQRMQDGEVSGVPARTWEYTGLANGNRFHSYVAGAVHRGYTYVVQGLYIEERTHLQAPVRGALNSFVFTDKGANVLPGAMGQGSLSQGMNQGGGKATGGTGTPVAGLKDRAWRTSGNMGVQWKLAHGSVKPGEPSVWELTTTRSLGLHFRDPYNQGKQRYLVKIVDKPTGTLLHDLEVVMMSKVRVGPGHFVVTVSPVSGYAGWKCEWD